MRHGKKVKKLQRRESHRTALIKNLCKQLVEHRRIKTTLAKAKAVRPFAERLLTLGKKAITAKGKDEQETIAKGVHYRRMAYRTLQDRALIKMLEDVASASLDRPGGYTRITKLGQRMSDSAPMAFIEWVDAFVPKSAVPEAEDSSAEEETPAEKPKKKAAAKAEKPAKKEKAGKAEKAPKAEKPEKAEKPKKKK